MKSLYLLCLLLITLPAFSQTGMLKGKVTDAETADPMPFATILIVSDSSAPLFGTTTDFDGNYTIKPLDHGVYDVKASFVGYKNKLIEDVVISKDKITFLDIKMKPSSEALEEVVFVNNSSPLISNDKTFFTKTITSQEIAKIPGRSAHSQSVSVGGVYSQNGQLTSIRGSRNQRNAFYIDGVRDVQPDALAEDYNTESYQPIFENDFMDVMANPLSTFSIDVDRASYANTRRYLNGNQLPPPGAVRIEEMINYFKYDYPEPDNENPFSIYLEGGACPWNPEHQLVMIGLKGTNLSKEEKTASNLVFLIDVSGSMQAANKLDLVKKSMNILIDKLDPEDKVSIVVYAGAAGLVLEPTAGSEKAKIKKAINKLSAGGSTAGGQGILLAYKTAKEQFIKGGNNRVILATDGDFNIGVTDNSSLVEMIEEKREEGIFLTILGFGMGNYKDDRMEMLSNAGNGNYAYIDNVLEANKIFGEELYGTLFTIAKDVKIQIEFNPGLVKAYRLIGYENRLLDEEDFNDDTKDAGEIGAGHTVTAFYEVIPTDSDEKIRKTDSLKYQSYQLIESPELLTVKFRYKKPDGKKSKLIERSLFMSDVKQGEQSMDFLYAASVAEFGLMLRNSAFKENASYETAIKRAKQNQGEDPYGYRAECIRLMKVAGMLSSKD